MSIDEANSILESSFENYKNIWEQVRFTAYIQASSMGAKLKAPKDLIKFTWDTDSDIDILPPEETEKRKQALLSFMQNANNIKEIKF
jgi:hypothetical protein